VEAWLVPSSFDALLLAVALAALAWRRARPRWRVALGVVVAWCWVGSTPAVENALARSLERRFERPAVVPREPDATVVVLGAGRGVVERDGVRVRLEADGWERVACAVELRARTGGRLLVTGGPPAPGAEPVAATMARAAVALGAPPASIVIEPRARDTLENVDFARALAGDGPAWLATSAIHLPRAMAVARARAWPARPWPCDLRASDHLRWWAWLPHPGVDFGAVTHELVGALWYRWRLRS
jgi:uncharacterized SAM-binding protein YcdF (DUF218 family)